MKQLPLLVISFYLLSCNKSNDVDYSKYSAISLMEKHSLITEKFVDNRNHWNNIDTALLYNPDTYLFDLCQLNAAGEMTITANGGLGDQYFNYDSLAYLRNFELESEIKFIRIKPNQNNDTRGVCYMDWGFEDINSHVNFIKFENNGLIDFGDSQGLSRAGVPIQGLNVNAYNKYTIRKVGNSIFYFVNERFIGKSSLHLIAGNNIGFRVFKNNVFTMRNFRFVKF